MKEEDAKQLQSTASYGFFNTLIRKIASKLSPEFNDLAEDQQVIVSGDIFTVLFNVPLVVFGIPWLVNSTELDLISTNLPIFGLFFVFILLFNRLNFFLTIELMGNKTGTSDGSLSGIVTWSAYFIYGPTAIWLSLIANIVNAISNWRALFSASRRWSQLRTISMNITGSTLVPLIALSVYRRLGGIYPFPALSIESISPAFGALMINFVLLVLLWAGYIVYYLNAQIDIENKSNPKPILIFYITAIGLPHLATPFSILAAGLLSQNGLIVYLFFIAGMFSVAALARQLSRSAEYSRQQSKMLKQLEQLGRAIINQMPNKGRLADILKEYLPNMFPAGRLLIWEFPETILYVHPNDWHLRLDEIWPWLLGQEQPSTFLPWEQFPWQNNGERHRPTIIIPIRSIESSQTYGGIFLELRTLTEPWDEQALKSLVPAMQTLSDQIASAHNQAKVYSQALEFERVSEELRVAGDIQSSLLPYSFPDLPGWQIAVSLDPAGETSGDFFDIIPLEDGKIGLVIADVLDKGIGPAIYMALSRTLIRTYATEFDVSPEVVLFAANERILKDTNANLFVTVFFGVLDPATGELSYANAGHNPPLILSGDDSIEHKSLIRTGLPIGVEESAWEIQTAIVNQGDVFVLYTDGIPEAQNEADEFFKINGLLNTIYENISLSAEDIHKSILLAVEDFMGDTPQFDDITLMVLVRDT